MSSSTCFQQAISDSDSTQHFEGKLNSGFPFPFNAVPFEALNQEEHVRIVGFREKFNPFPHELQHHEEQLSHQHPPTGDHQQSAFEQLFMLLFFSGNKSRTTSKYFPFECLNTNWLVKQNVIATHEIFMLGYFLACESWAGLLKDFYDLGGLHWSIVVKFGLWLSEFLFKKCGSRLGLMHDALNKLHRLVPNQQKKTRFLFMLSLGFLSSFLLVIWDATTNMPLQIMTDWVEPASTYTIFEHDRACRRHQTLNFVTNWELYLKTRIFHRTCLRLFEH